MTLKRCGINKSGLIIMAFILISSSVNAQVSSTTLGEPESDRYDEKYGQFILEMPFGAKLFKNNYNNGKDLLNNIKNSCKGKAIFIDKWATWCKPCLEEMPNTKRLQSETKDLSIEFIYICTDLNTNIDNWITNVSILRQPGIHIFVKNEVINEMTNILFKQSDSFSGGGFPVYLFIDKNGQFRPEAIPLNIPPTTERLIKWISIPLNPVENKPKLLYETDLIKLKQGIPVVLDNVNFKFDSYDLIPTSLDVLKAFLTYLENNPEIKISIEGHTDDIGTEEYNDGLSVNRARSVYNWLINKGISSFRLSFTGFGKSRPIFDEKDEEHRALNRRVEVRIIKN